MNFRQIVSGMRAAKAQERPRGWQTLSEVAEELGMSRGHTSRLLCKMVADGTAESMRWVKRDELGMAAPSKLFRVKK